MGCNTTGHSQTLKNKNVQNDTPQNINLHPEVPVDRHRYEHAGKKSFLHPVTACNTTSERTN